MWWSLVKPGLTIRMWCGHEFSNRLVLKNVDWAKRGENPEESEVFFCEICGYGDHFTAWEDGQLVVLAYKSLSGSVSRPTVYKLVHATNNHDRTFELHTHTHIHWVIFKILDHQKGTYCKIKILLDPLSYQTLKLLCVFHHITKKKFVYTQIMFIIFCLSYS